MQIRRLDRSGYTIIELLAVLIVFSVLGILFIYLVRQNSADARDIERKRDIAAIYFSLEASKDPQKGYPEYPNASNLKGIDPEALQDPKKVKLGDANAEYRYFGQDCKDGFCKSFELKVNLEKEAELIKKSPS
jgi:prepilin-type N-terminal cleavage/methylation domain-containing protein